TMTIGGFSMADAKLPKGVKRITIVRHTAEEAQVPTVYPEEKKRKKQSKGLRFLERAVRLHSKSKRIYADTYAARHERSNRKRRDGWLKDYLSNVARAHRKAKKQVRWSKLFT